MGVPVRRTETLPSCLADTPDSQEALSIKVLDQISEAKVGSCRAGSSNRSITQIDAPDTSPSARSRGSQAMSGSRGDFELSPVWCTTGIVVSLMVYGLLQERIMTTPFAEGGRLFTASVFLVLANRLATLFIAVAMSAWEGHPVRPLAPLTSYAGISLANVVATTCQYDALKYVSFPVATLGKCAKMIPVMIWGTVMNRKKYTRSEYSIAVVITLGCTFFVLTGEIRSRVLDDHHVEGVEYMYGGMLMATYLAFDGFTSTLQERLFSNHKDVTIYNQITFCCICSSFMALSATLSDGQLWTAISFIREYPHSLWAIVGLSLSAGTAQLFISYTIKQHGALAFATVMTTRQFLSILVSCAVFLHPLTIGQWISTAVIFGALYLKVCFKPGLARAPTLKAITPRSVISSPRATQLRNTVTRGDMDVRDMLLAGVTEPVVDAEAIRISDDYEHPANHRISPA